MKTDVLFEVEPISLVNKTMFSINGCSPHQVLSSIESTPEAFTDGRRNNDMVNWFVAKRLIDLEDDEPVGRSHREKVGVYIAAFRDLLSRMNHRQKMCMAAWNENWEYKIQVLCEHYDQANDPGFLRYLWLAMDYNVPATW
jgi:hypothetical protein